MELSSLKYKGIQHLYLKCDQNAPSREGNKARESREGEKTKKYSLHNEVIYLFRHQRKNSKEDLKEKESIGPQANTPCVNFPYMTSSAGKVILVLMCRICAVDFLKGLKLLTHTE